MRIELKIQGQDDKEKVLWIENIVDSGGATAANVKVSIYQGRDKPLVQIVISAAELARAANLLKG